MALARLRLRQLKCFYCGVRSSQKWKGTAQQWRCGSCDAINYLDHNGQIADPPAQSTPEPARLVRYARAFSPPAQDASSNADVFCSTCLKNQHLLKETLSAYLPPEDNPNFNDYAEAYDSYREELERRYPQVCPRCAPKARERIRKATYVAKTDHLRRMMDLTKQTGVSNLGSSRFRSVLIVTAGLLSHISSLTQALWHGVVALSLSKGPQRELGVGEDGPLLKGSYSFENRSLDVYRDRILALHQSYDLAKLIPLALLASLLTIWWHPRMLKQKRYPRARLRGAGEFYFLQGSVLLARLAAFRMLQSPSLALSPEMLRGAHIFMGAIIVFAIMISSNTIQLDTEPRFTFPAKEDPILPHVPQPTSDESIMTSDRTPRAKSDGSFPISQLASAPTQNLHINSPPTPPPDDNDYDPDSMDWSPSVNSPQFHPNPRAQPMPPPPPPGPSPFHGTLPPAPVPLSHKLRNPGAHQPGTFRKATDEQQSNFFSKISSPPRRSKRLAKNANPQDSDETGMTTDDDDGTIDTASVASFTNFAGKKKKHDLNMANPSFFPAEDQRDTGLEDLFTSSFGLQDTPKAVSARFSNPQGPNATPRGQNPKVTGQPTAGERWGGFGEVVERHDAHAEPQEDPGHGRRRLLTMAAPAAALAVGLSVWGAVS